VRRGGWWESKIDEWESKIDDGMRRADTAGFVTFSYNK
jgi:hypothetical protein